MKALIAVGMLFWLTLVHAEENDPWHLLHQGKIEEAAKGYEKQVQLAQSSRKLDRLWSAYMQAAWFYHQIGRNRPAIDYSNKALEVGEKLRQPFYIGRSLAWLGWTYADMGLYDLSLEFYKRGIEVGAPEGVITHVAVWGLSKQEMGYVYMRKGDLVQARSYMEETTNFARKHGISVGVAEGAAHLAELALIEGKYTQAETLAAEAIAAAQDCDCSPLNMARALTVASKAILAMAKDNPDLRPTAAAKIQESLDFSQKIGITRYTAEGKLLKAKILDTDRSTERLSLISEAFDLLSRYENEQRGVAESELGMAFLQASQMQLANFYLQHGLQVNQEMFRRVDVAYSQVGIAELHGIQGGLQKRLLALQQAAEQSGSSGAWVDALENAELLSQELNKLGYLSLARGWTKTALKYVNQILDNPNPALTKENLFARKLALTQQLVELELKLQNSPRSNGES